MTTDAPIHPSRVSAIAAAAANDDGLTLHQAAVFIGKEYKLAAPPHHASVWRWASRGVNGVTLKTYRIGGRRFIRPSDIRAFMTAINGAASSAA